ncbi:MAG TPA: DUF4842 domain-containing protein [Gemmatimonadales bacterium]
MCAGRIPEGIAASGAHSEAALHLPDAAQGQGSRGDALRPLPDRQRRFAAGKATLPGSLEQRWPTPLLPGPRTTAADTPWSTGSRGRFSFPAGWDWPVERVPINCGHLEFVTWATSVGTAVPDWYVARPDNRNYRYLFHRLN